MYVCMIIILQIAAAQSPLGGIAIRYILRTSGFLDGIVFSYIGLYGSMTLTQQPCCNVVYVLTLPLCGTACLLS